MTISPADTQHKNCHATKHC